MRCAQAHIENKLNKALPFFSPHRICMKSSFYTAFFVTNNGWISKSHLYLSRDLFRDALFKKSIF